MISRWGKKVLLRTLLALKYTFVPQTRFLIRDLSPATFYRIKIKTKRFEDSSELRSITQGTSEFP